MTKSLALDASLTNCGYCIGTDGQYQESGQYKPNDKTDWIDRIQEISRWLYKLTMEHNFDVVFYEKPSGHSGNKETDLKLGALWYSVQLFCRLRNIDFVNVSPSEVKKTMIFKIYKTSKGQTINYLGLRAAQFYNDSFKVYYKSDGSINEAAMKRQDDEIDSVGVFLAGWQKYE